MLARGNLSRSYNGHGQWVGVLCQTYKHSGVRLQASLACSLWGATKDPQIQAQIYKNISTAYHSQTFITKSKISTFQSKHTKKHKYISTAATATKFDHGVLDFKDTRRRVQYLWLEFDYSRPVTSLHNLSKTEWTTPVWFLRSHSWPTAYGT